MKRLKKLLAVLLVAVVAITSCFAFGCGSTGSTEGTLNIYVLHRGYGHDWCSALIEEFKNQDWVKQKYPDYKVELTFTAYDPDTDNEMQKGAASKFDLLFSQYTQPYNGQTSVEDITDTVYNTLVPGEEDKGITVKQKMIDGFASSNSFIDSEGNERYSTFSFVNGMYGILYNVEKLSALGEQVPVTTDELLAVMQRVKQLNKTNSAYPYTHSIANSNNGYSYQMFSTWWAQYEGTTEYENFYKGIANSIKKNPEVLNQKGRLESLKVLEQLFKATNGYLHPQANSADFDASVAQVEFMSGQGLFHFNGDYFTTEMEPLKDAIIQNNGGVEYTLKFMKNPVISSIVDRLTSIKTAATNAGVTNDQMLATLVRDIDNNVITCTNSDVSASDYEALKEARNMVNSSSSHAGMIPSWSKNKEIAADFLRFMATDVAFEAVLEATKGLALPFKYDVKTNNPTLYASLDPAQKAKIDIYANQTIPVTVVKEHTAFKLGRAGLTPLASIIYNNKVAFESVFGLQVGAKTAQQVFDDDAKYWQNDDNARWVEICGIAGL